MPSNPDTLAPRACIACRDKKRKCSRELPACALCRRNRKRCDYPAPDADSADEPSTLQAPSQFPALFFLDQYKFVESRGRIVPSRSDFPPMYQDVYENMEELRALSHAYFTAIHPVFPIVSKLQIHRLLGRSDSLLAEYLPLFAAMGMHVVIREPGEPCTTHAYRQAKRVALFAEENNLISIRLLQAYLLIALYEIGHGVYPAAYLTVGHCARLAHAMGIHNKKDAPQMLPKPVSWNEAEERRRAWWATLILDKYVNVGGECRPFACEEATPTDLLPMDEASWEVGEAVMIQPLAVSASSSIPSPPFARTCQASHLLSRVLRHLSQKSPEPASHYDEAIQLHNTLEALERAVDQQIDELMPFVGGTVSVTGLLPSMGICCSARLALYYSYVCVDENSIGGVGSPGQLDMQLISIEELKGTCMSVKLYAELISTVMEVQGALHISPLSIDCLYQAASIVQGYIEETGNNEFTEVLDLIVGTLTKLADKWSVAQEYLKALDATKSSNVANMI